MFKQLSLYYVFVTLPFALLLVGSVAFFDAIKGTITRNPHPQINYVIFIIIIFGGILITLSAYFLVREARILKEYSEAVRAGTEWPILQKITNNYTGDLSFVLQILAASGGRAISHQEQTAIEHEHTATRNHLFRRNALPQYLTGLLVGMGLLGTFIGLLATLNDISILISSFAELDMTTANPLTVFRNMIERMKAPMQSMAIAFSASMYGLLGSIILGLMMLGIRRLQGDITSLLGSLVARHIETALSYDEGNVVHSGHGAGHSGDESKVLTRIEERLAEAARLQQRTLTSEMNDFHQQRADMLRTLGEQTEASNKFRNELQQLAMQFEIIITILEKGNGEMFSRLSDLTVNVAGDAKESHKLLAMQIDEQRKLRESLDSCKIEERLAESARVQQRALASEIADFQKQRTDMVRTLAEQTEASNNFRSELQQLGRQLGPIYNAMDKGNDEIRNQISELMIHMAADAKESHNLLAMQVNEQKKLRESLDWRKSSNND